MPAHKRRGTARLDQPLVVEPVPVAELHEDPANVRRHGPRNLAAIRASLARFGQRKPIVVGPGGLVVAGNGTLAAARELGWPTVAVVRTVLAGAEAAAFAIADNRTAELAEWDNDALSQMLEALREQDAELARATAFLNGEIDALADRAEENASAAEQQLGDPRHSLLVECDGEAHQAFLLARFEGEGLRCRALML